MRALGIEKVRGLAFIQDDGQPNRLARGVPRGGPLDPEGLANARAACGGRIGDAFIERSGALTLRAYGDLVVGTSDGRTHTLRDRAELELSWGNRFRVEYVAIGQGLLGERRDSPLRPGERLGVGDRRNFKPVAFDACLDDASAAFEVIVGPDLDAFAPSAEGILTSRTFVVSARSDRVGTRLGPEESVETMGITWSAVFEPRTTPMIAGAIEVPPSGELIVLGPDHPTTGGYPVIACVRERELSRLHRAKIGSVVRFRVATR